MGRHGDGLCGADGAARNGTPWMPRGPPGGVRAPQGATLRRVTARSEAPASFRSSSVSPGSLGLITEGIREVLSRRRLILYIVRADLKKSGADTLLGNVWWVVDPLIQMLIYSVLVTLIFDRQVPDYGLFVFSAILPWKWFEATVKDGVSAITSQERLIKQIYFPKLVLPLAAVSAGVVNFAFGLIPLVGLTLVALRRPAQPVAAAHPGRRGRPVRVLAVGRDRAVRGQRLLPRRRQPVPPPAPVLVLPVPDAVQPGAHPQLELREGERVGGGGLQPEPVAYTC